MDTGINQEQGPTIVNNLLIKNIKGDFQGAKCPGLVLGDTNTIKPTEEKDSQRLVASEVDQL
jgi:hypothetical protein